MGITGYNDNDIADYFEVAYASEIIATEVRD